MKKLLLVSAVAATSLMASGYKIPEQSLNSTALAGAYVSNTSAADAAYYNPANMAFMGEDKYLELNLMYAHLNPIKFSGQVVSPVTQKLSTVHTAESASEDFVIPQIYIVGATIGEDEDIRFGISLNSPAGLSKRWPEGVESAYAEEFTLKTVEINPSFSYRIMENLAVAAGVRFVYSKGVIKTSGTDPLDLEGNSWDAGYNLALSYKPFEEWGMALTYRSNIDLRVDGRQAVTDPAYVAMGVTSTPASVTVPLPAVATFATDVDVTESTNIEFTYERTFWSAYEDLNIQIPAFGPLPGMPVAKDWKDTNTFRLGLTQGFGDSLKLMLGVAYDETPVPDKTLGFELPDSNAVIGSIGVRWAVNDELDLGAAFLYDQKDDRFVSLEDNGVIDGTFSGMSATLLSVGLGYKF